jgi:hypothetical protein
MRRKNVASDGRQKLPRRRGKASRQDIRLEASLKLGINVISSLQEPFDLGRERPLLMDGRDASISGDDLLERVTVDVKILVEPPSY